MPSTSDRRIFHFTDHANLPGIVADGGISSDTKIKHGVRPVKECANAEIKSARRCKAVPIPPGGHVSNYVPFYYATRSPMMSAISSGRVPGYRDSTRLVYLVSSIGKVESVDNLQWICTDGNAAAGITAFFDTRQELDFHTDWAVMEMKYWRNTQDDGDRRRRRMAEFLVWDFFPLPLVSDAITHSEMVGKSVREIVPAHIRVHVRPDCYI